MSNPTVTLRFFLARTVLISLSVSVFLSCALTHRVFSHRANSPETLALFSSDNFTTPKSVFTLGEKAWALNTGALPDAVPQLRFQWVAPDGAIQQQSQITKNNQSDSFQIPASAPVGTWRVKIVDGGNLGLAVAEFVVRDPAKAFADLSVSVTGPSQITLGNPLTYTVKVINNGPDDAQEIELEDAVPQGGTLQSFEASREWGCSTSSSEISCRSASLAKGASAVFTIVYQIETRVETSASTVTTISNTAVVSSRTKELHQPDNGATAHTQVVVSGCALSCVENVVQSHEAGLDGATVYYNDPSASRTCNKVICNPPSGGFFQAGVTTVTCSSENGDACSFTVTVTGTVSIQVAGANPLLVECHTEFTDPEVTARNGEGKSVTVTSSGIVDTSKPGKYTVTYTAADGASTATATRTVEVVDTTPPVLDCPADVFALADANCQAVVPNLAAKVKVVDNCTLAEALVITQSPAAGTRVGVGVTEITVTVRDASGNVSNCAVKFSVNEVTGGSATLRVGLKESADAGIKLDLLAEVLKNGKLIAAGQRNDLSGGGPSLDQAIAQTIKLALSAPATFCSGDTLSLRLSVRAAMSSTRRSGTARLWFNEAAAGSSLAVALGGITNHYFLRDGLVLGAADLSATSGAIDVWIDRAVNNNPFKPFGTWNLTLFR